jgi:hypothetical protein
MVRLNVNGKVVDVDVPADTPLLCHQASHRPRHKEHHDIL